MNIEDVENELSEVTDLLKSRRSPNRAHRAAMGQFVSVFNSLKNQGIKAQLGFNSPPPWMEEIDNVFDAFPLLGSLVEKTQTGIRLRPGVDKELVSQIRTHFAENPSSPRGFVRGLR